MRYRKVNLCLAMNVGHGLVVPVIRDADRYNLQEYAEKYFELSKKAVADALVPEDMAGGTFTVTDLSGMKAMHFFPVINEKQSAILGICAPRYVLEKRNETEIVPTNVFEVILVFDHRVADGKQALEFLNDIKHAFE